MAVVLSFAATAAAWGFDYARYQEADLDDLLAAQRPKVGEDDYPSVPCRITADLVSYGESCNTRHLKAAMRVLGTEQAWLDHVPINTCIKIRSAKGAVLRVFIQDKVAEVLPKEAPLGSKAVFYAAHVYTLPDEVGLLVNEFSGRGTNVVDGCGYGGVEGHAGKDFHGPEGSPIPALDDGVVVKIETDENAMVDARHTGWCGRYIVVRHDYPNGRQAFTRIAELGRIVGGDGNPLKIGAHVVKGDTLGEIGGSGMFHFEVRPVEPATMNTSVVWQRRYGGDPAMEWSKYPPVDPAKFDPDVFGGRAEAK